MTPLFRPRDNAVGRPRMTRPQGLHAPPRAQRGAIGIFGISALVLTLAFAVLALDTGRLALEKRRLQQVADLAAIDALQQAGLCSGSESMTAAAALAAAQQSAVRNGYTGDLSDEAGAVLLGVVTTDSNGIRQFTGTADAAASAVQVTARKQVVRSLVAGGWYGGTVSLQAVGVAQREPLAGFWAGSFLASVDSEDATVLDGVLSGLLGSSVSLDAVSYQGLVDADLTLAQLIDGAALAGVSLSADGVDGLLDTQVTVADLLSIMAAALGAEGDATAAAAINDLQAAATLAGTIRIGDLLDVAVDNPDAALESGVNVYALGSAALQLAREGQTLNMPVTATLPLVGGAVDVSMHITDAPRIAVGPPGRDEDGNWKTAVSTAQMQLQIDVSVTDAPLFTVLLGVVNASVDLSVATEVARTDAWLAGIRCAGATHLEHRVTIGAAPGAARLALGRYADPGDPDTLIEDATEAEITLATTPIATVAISAQAVMSGDGARDLDFLVYRDPENPPHLNLPLRQTVATPLASALDGATQDLAESLIVDPELLGAPVPGVTDAAIRDALRTVVLEPVLTALDEAVLLPVFRALGINLGGADVELFRLDADESRLVR